MVSTHDISGASIGWTEGGGDAPPHYNLVEKMAPLDGEDDDAFRARAEARARALEADPEAMRYVAVRRLSVSFSKTKAAALIIRHNLLRRAALTAAAELAVLSAKAGELAALAASVADAEDVEATFVALHGGVHLPMVRGECRYPVELAERDDLNGRLRRLENFLNDAIRGYVP